MKNYTGIFSVATLKVLFEQKEQTPPIIDALVGQLYNLFFFLFLSFFLPFRSLLKIQEPGALK